MSKQLLVIDKQSKGIINAFEVDESFFDISDWQYDPQNPEKYLVVDPGEGKVFLGIGEDEYIESKKILQPIEPHDESWVKDEHGVWTVMYDRPSPSHFWYQIISDWFDVKDYEGSKTDQEILGNS